MPTKKITDPQRAVLGLIADGKVEYSQGSGAFNAHYYRADSHRPVLASTVDALIRGGYVLEPTTLAERMGGPLTKRVEIADAGREALATPEQPTKPRAPRTGGPLKVYTDRESNNGFASANVIEALGEGRHVRQVHFYIVASTKEAACEVAKAHAGLNRAPRDLALSQGNATTAMLTAGMFAAESVFACRLGDRGPVVRIAEGGDGTQLVGNLAYSDRIGQAEFTPAAPPQPVTDVDPQSIPSADLPHGTIVATDAAVWMKAATASPFDRDTWRGMGPRGNRWYTDEELDRARGDGAQILRVGHTGS